MNNTAVLLFIMNINCAVVTIHLQNSSCPPLLLSTTKFYNLCLFSAILDCHVLNLSTLFRYTNCIFEPTVVATVFFISCICILMLRLFYCNYMMFLHDLSAVRSSYPSSIIVTSSFLIGITVATSFSHLLLSLRISQNPASTEY